ncbi:hypothetical protein EKG37_09690 [Robertmurraya yapensis]|uniref:CAP domain-containing protein n=2 Tax=Bacillaceae TaxID=186817 RepID=A0A3S0RMZ7_9BACI|nr:CAP domain-containing protein [Bacillus yapensis]RTR32426.1 hypothetical protein EKG37_09690 [Bacillus yapensis]TKS96620.1 hypothetical protein FAR12_09690 [Bacillus yapensis]
MAVVLSIVFYLHLYLLEDFFPKDEIVASQVKATTEVEEKEQNQIELPTEGLATFIGKDAAYVEEQLGQPERIDPSAYDYDWWIYKKGLSEYIQVGIANNKVVTLYAIGQDVNITPFKIGEKVENLYAKIPIKSNINVENEGSSYRFELTEEDINTHPLVQIGSFYVQVFLDKFDGTVSSIRFMDAETLIKQQPYELVYLGELLQASPIDAEKEKAISTGASQQIFDISNLMRVRHDLKPLEWDEKTSEVALAHSVDMFESQEFSHTSQKNGELSDRLEEGEVFYQLAGENIAANYTDAPAVMEGWLNSKSHRETLLNGEFTHLGVGVYQLHYTQNFIQKW